MATKIVVTRIWQQGYSKHIRLGEYEIDDIRLLGKGQYLVDNGFATIIEDDKPIEKVEEKPVKQKRKATRRKKEDE